MECIRLCNPTLSQSESSNNCETLCQSAPCRYMKTTFGSASLCRSKTLCQSASLKWRSNTQYVNEICGVVVKVEREEK